VLLLTAISAQLADSQHHKTTTVSICSTGFFTVLRTGQPRRLKVCTEITRNLLKHNFNRLGGLPHISNEISNFTGQSH